LAEVQRQFADFNRSGVVLSSRGNGHVFAPADQRFASPASGVFSPKQGLQRIPRVSNLCPPFSGIGWLRLRVRRERAASERKFMAVKIRMKRIGAKNQPVFRIVVADGRSPRDGKFIEELGTYWPEKKSDNVKFDLERAKYWLSKGAQPSDTVASFIKKASKAAAASA
jgi:small subunit ribosomal protein S16